LAFPSWTDDQGLTFTNWGPNEPSEAANKCVELLYHGTGIYTPGHWQTVDCDQKRPFVCQLKLDSKYQDDPNQGMFNFCLKYLTKSKRQIQTIAQLATILTTLPATKSTRAPLLDLKLEQHVKTKITAVEDSLVLSQSGTSMNLSLCRPCFGIRTTIYGLE